MRFMRNGLSLNSDLALYSIHDEKACTSKSIGQRWIILKQTVHTFLQGFEVRGYIELVHVPEDKRNKQIHLTQTGRELADTIVKKLHDMELYAMKRMGLERMRTLNDSLALFITLFRDGSSDTDE